MAIRIVKKYNPDEIDINIFFNNHNSRYYTHYKEEALREINGKINETTQLKTSKKLFEKYKMLNPFDATPVINGIPPEAYKTFVDKKIELNLKLHELIINEAVKDVFEADENLVIKNKTAQIKIDSKDILTQTKYLELVIKALQEKAATKSTRNIKKIDTSNLTEETKEIIGNTILNMEKDLLTNFEGDLQNTSNIIKDHLQKLTEATEGLSQYKDIKYYIDRTYGFVNNNIVANKLEHILKMTKKELAEFKNNKNIEIKDIVGLSTYTDQLSKFNDVLSDKNIKISTNFFNEENDLFGNSFTFLYGWTMEQLTTIRMQGLDMYKDKEIKVIDANDWDRVTHFQAITKLYFFEKIITIEQQISSYKNSEEKTFTIEGKELKKEEIINYLFITLDTIRKIQNNVTEKIISTYLIDTENLSVKMKEILKENDETLHNNTHFTNASNLFFEDKYKSMNIKNYVKNLKDTIIYIDKNLKFQSLNPDVKMNNYALRAIRNYTINKRIPTMDTIVHTNGKIDEVQEIKTLSIKTGDIKLPLYFSKETLNSDLMNEIFTKQGYRYTFNRNNIGKMKENQDKIFDKQTNRLNKLEDLKINIEDTYYVFNCIDEVNGRTYIYRIPLDEFEEMFLDKDFLDKATLGKRNAYKFFVDVDYEFFAKKFNNFLIPKEEIQTQSNNNFKK